MAALQPHACMQEGDEAGELPGRGGRAAAGGAAVHALPHGAEVCASAGVVGGGAGARLRLGAALCCSAAGPRVPLYAAMNRRSMES